MVYDCFPFFNELDILELRLHILDAIVDKFVLVEATKTHSNKPKPLYFQENKHRYARFLDKIIHIVIDDYPPFVNAWTYENHQRNGIERGLKDCLPTDLILISDCDEIPNPEQLAGCRNTLQMRWMECLQFNYYLNYFCATDPFWVGTRVFPYSAMFGKTAQEMRRVPVTHKIPFGGWHFSYMGGLEKLIEKTEAYAHQEHNLEKNKNRVQLAQKVAQGKDIYGKSHRFKPVIIDANFPDYLQKHQVAYAHLLWQEKATYTITTLLSRFERKNTLKRLLGWPYILAFWNIILFKQYNRRDFLKKILPKSLSFLLEKESRKLERGYLNSEDHPT